MFYVWVLGTLRVSVERALIPALGVPSTCLRAGRRAEIKKNVYVLHMYMLSYEQANKQASKQTNNEAHVNVYMYTILCIYAYRDMLFTYLRADD